MAREKSTKAGALVAVVLPDLTEVTPVSGSPPDPSIAVVCDTVIKDFEVVKPQLNLEFDDGFIDGSKEIEASRNEMTKKLNDLFSNNRGRNENSVLKYIPPAVKDGVRYVSFNSNEVRKEEDRWKFSIIGCVYGDGPYTFDQKPLMLKKWHPRMSMDPNAISSVPVWIQLPGLPWEFWSFEMLSKIGSFCGTPLYSDQCTLSKVKLNFARVLVEMEVAGPFPEVVELQDECGNVFKQKIVYEWKPLFCEKCCRMGHSIKNCRVGQNTKKAIGTIKSLEVKEGISEEVEHTDSIIAEIVINDKQEMNPNVDDMTVQGGSKINPKSRKGEISGRDKGNSFKVLESVSVSESIARVNNFSSNMSFGSVGDGRNARLNSRMIDIDR
ncbi:uncharacterized protein LOC126681838 [Mercurialis annua]|uniref:uncharacterized protein LOC126681838 n=1 Tax=Mercurialis annua TaxID=3986 RepID=UPI002160B11C|nr:uncharacterized protein LOC126681838 [Mercurialis annua]